MAFLVEQAGGQAFTGNQRALDLVPKKIHDRSPIFLGSYDDIEEIKALYAAEENNDHCVAVKFDANSKAHALEFEVVKSSGSEQDETQKYESELDEYEVRLSQLQHQLPSNALGALMHFVEDASVEDADDYETKKCKTLFKNAYYEKEELL
ncbi:fructose-bisphosphatase [Sarracenia purpurea var. burkii]